jgi:hypothetical protein
MNGMSIHASESELPTMKKVKSYATVIRRWYRSTEHECVVCHRPLQQAMTLSRRTVVTLQAVIKLIHAGYRCPDVTCLGRSRIYRSMEADALALPSFTYGLDIVVLVGQFHLGKHQTIDEVHHEVQARLSTLGVSISRREILSLFDAYCTLLRAASEAKQDLDFLAQVEEHGGIIVSVDGIQPDRGNETMYIVRDVLTGRVLVAENVISSETTVMKALLAPVVALDVKVLGTITDAQESELQAVEQLWPDVPHQVCQFHVLREASRPGFEADRQVKTALRKRLGAKVRATRRQLTQDLLHAEASEVQQVEVLQDYALSIQTALNRDGTLPFAYPGVQVGDDLDAIAESLAQLKKKGA